MLILCVWSYFLLATFVLSLPYFFFSPPLCFNYHRTPALWPNYGPGASVNRSARCAPNIPARKRGKRDSWCEMQWFAIPSHLSFKMCCVWKQRCTCTRTACEHVCARFPSYRWTGLLVRGRLYIRLRCVCINNIRRKKGRKESLQWPRWLPMWAEQTACCCFASHSLLN